MPENVTRLEAELLALGQLEAGRAAEIRALALEQADLADWLARVDGEIVSAAADMPALDLSAPSVEAEPMNLPAPANRPARAGRYVSMAAAVAAVGLVMVLGVAAAVRFLGPPDPTAVVYRGSFDLEVTQMRQGNVVESGAWVDALPGDRLQFTITPAEDAWVMVYDVEDGGEVHVFQEPIEVDGGRAHTAAVLLDDYEGAERIFVLVGEEPVELEDVREAALAAHRTPLAELDALPGLQVDQRSVWITKGGR